MRNVFLLTKWLKMRKKVDKSTEEKILIAARKIFIAKGMSGARMQDIADELGMNKALLHYYFKSKEQLFSVIFKETIEKFIPKIKILLNSDKNLYEKIELFCDEYISMAIESPYIPLFILNEMNKQPAKFIAKIFKGELLDLSKFSLQIEEEIKKGKIRHISPSNLIMNMLGMCIFPFIAKPMLSATLGLDELQFQLTMQQRKKEIPKFIFNSIKK